MSKLLTTAAVGLLLAMTATTPAHAYLSNQRAQHYMLVAANRAFVDDGDTIRSHNFLRRHRHTVAVRWPRPAGDTPCGACPTPNDGLSAQARFPAV